MTVVFNAEARELIRRAVRQVLSETPPARRGLPSSRSTVYIGMTDGSGVTARSGATPGSGTVTLQNVDSDGDLTNQTDESAAVVNVTAYNLSTTAVGASGYVMLALDQLTGNYWVIWEDCEVA